MYAAFLGCVRVRVCVRVFAPHTLLQGFSNYKRAFGHFIKQFKINTKASFLTIK